MILRIVIVAIAFALSTIPAHAKLKVVASFSILADMASRAGENEVEIHTLVGPNGDAHAFQPTPANAKAVAEADVIILNGLGFEPWAERLMKSAKPKGLVIIASDGLDVGEADTLRESMQELQRRSASVVWLNPLLDTPGYEPTAAGMRAARPFITTFTSVNDAAALWRLARVIRVRA